MKYNSIIPIGCDHAGFSLKEELKIYLEEQGYEVKDYGCYSEESIDYPDFGHAVAADIESNEGRLGILICGSGNGISMTANKHKDIRCALSWTKDIAELARLHNDANIVSMPARFITSDIAKEIVDVFFTTAFEGGRHQRRVNKIGC